MQRDSSDNARALLLKKKYHWMIRIECNLFLWLDDAVKGMENMLGTLMTKWDFIDVFFFFAIFSHSVIAFFFLRKEEQNTRPVDVK